MPDSALKNRWNTLFYQNSIIIIMNRLPPMKEMERALAARDAFYER